jgi:hypothetical protein
MDICSIARATAQGGESRCRKGGRASRRRPPAHRSGRCRIIGASRRLDHSIGPSRHVPLPVLTGPFGSRPPPPRAAPFKRGSDPARAAAVIPRPRDGGSDPRLRRIRPGPRPGRWSPCRVDGGSGPTPRGSDPPSPRLVPPSGRRWGLTPSRSAPGGLTHHHPGWFPQPAGAGSDPRQARLALRGYATDGSVSTFTSAGLPLSNARSRAGRSSSGERTSSPCPPSAAATSS